MRRQHLALLGDARPVCANPNKLWFDVRDQACGDIINLGECSGNIIIRRPDPACIGCPQVQLVDLETECFQFIRFFIDSTIGS